MSQSLMPTLFIGHGSPMHCVQEGPITHGWRRIADELPRPEAVLCISAHWSIPGVHVCPDEYPRTIHDFYGFPPEMYALSYPAPGHPDLAAEVREMLAPFDCQEDATWGLDHGAWCPLLRMYPRFDVPVVQLSVDHRRPPSKHYEIGKLLAPLREKRVLILGSGDIVHNLGMVDWEAPGRGAPWAEHFRARTGELIREGRHQELVELAEWHAEDDEAAEEARLSIPTPDHYLPLLYVLGAAGEDAPIRLENDSCDMGSVSMTCVIAG